MLKKLKKLFLKKQIREDIDVSHFKKILKKEHKRLENELRGVGEKQNGEWRARATDVDVQSSDDADTADNMENYDSNVSMLRDLQIDYDNVTRALGKIKKGNYGICEVSGEPIEVGRLEANPSARTCMSHKDTKLAE